MNRTILIGDVLEKLKEIQSESIDCIITSPPYWGLRDYQVDGQLGLESNFKDYLKNMQKIMDELKRVLKKSGSCWINLGDCYGTHRSSQDNKMTAEKQERETIQGYEKSRIGIPERFYINCIDSGWIARNHIVWYKSNAMPSSVKDRLTNHWESVFFFVKNTKYYFNLDAVREKPITETKPFNVRVRDANKGKYGSLYSATDEEVESHNDKGERIDSIPIKEKYADEPASNVARLHREREGNPNKQNMIGKDSKPKANYVGFNDRWKERKWGPEMGTIASKHSGCFDADGNSLNHPNGKNPGDVFFINPKPFPKAHFATFPVELPLKILKCTCPKEGLVLDPFFGSGTVGVAAEMLGLRWIGIELKKEYVEIAQKRLEPFKNNKIEEFI